MFYVTGSQNLIPSSLVENSCVPLRSTFARSSGHWAFPLVESISCLFLPGCVMLTYARPCNNSYLVLGLYCLPGQSPLTLVIYFPCLWLTPPSPCLMVVSGTLQTALREPENSVQNGSFLLGFLMALLPLHLYTPPLPRAGAFRKLVCASVSDISLATEHP